MSADDAAVLAAALRALERAHAVEPAYAGPASPLRTDQLARLLDAAGCRVEVFPFLSTTVAMTLPRCAGVHPVFLTDDGVVSAQERAADLFALADLVPGWWLEWVGENTAAPGEMEAEGAGAVAEFAEAWPAERMVDRARLRLRLYEDRGI